jgi:protein-S-isoprenylcysteine O-methyltransferase Ste14
VRHPLYLSYIIGFSATVVAFPNAFAAVGWALAVAWFVYGAQHDERALKESALASDYAEYRHRTGMFIPVFRR